MNSQVMHHCRLVLSRCSLWEKGRALLTRQIVQPDQIEPICNVEERDVTEEDEDDEDGILFAI